MKWLITGADGQLGRSLQETLTLKGISYVALGRLDLDISNRELTMGMIKQIKPNVVVNTAAYTNVENAEIEPATAFEINQEGAANVAISSKAIGAKLIHFSTDYVFSGDKDSPWQVDDQPRPLSVYGKSKLAGESEITKRYPDNSIIIRTAWLYSPYGKNFYRTILNKAINSEEDVRIVCDQEGQPTSALDLAELTTRAISQNVESGIFHASNSGSCTWFDFASLIFQLSGKDVNRVIPVMSSEIATRVERPKYSVLDNQKWRKYGVMPLDSWEESVASKFSVISSSLAK
jgi:dTDP-4-dehydrorhamnose reductase